MLETDPIDLKLDDDGDLFIDEDGAHLTTGIEAVVQAVRFRLQLFRGEWFLNLDVGVPWFQEFLGEKYDPELLRQRLIEAIKDTPGVVEVVSLVIAFDSPTRKISVTWSVRSEFGDTDPDTLLVGGSS